MWEINWFEADNIPSEKHHLRCFLYLNSSLPTLVSHLGEGTTITSINHLRVYWWLGMVEHNVFFHRSLEGNRWFDFRFFMVRGKGSISFVRSSLIWLPWCLFFCRSWNMNIFITCWKYILVCNSYCVMESIFTRGSFHITIKVIKRNP